MAIILAIGIQTGPHIRPLAPFTALLPPSSVSVIVRHRALGARKWRANFNYHESLLGSLGTHWREGGGYPELMWWFLQGISCVTLWCAVRVSSCLKVQKLRQKCSKLVTSVPKNSTENLVFYKFLHHTPRFRGLSLQCASCRSWFLERIMLCFSVTFVFPASADFL